MKNWKNTYPLDVISGETKKELVCLIESLLEEQRKEIVKGIIDMVKVPENEIVNAMEMAIREHIIEVIKNNLKNIDIEIPKNKLVVMTGVSGSGKSSLAFDTIYAEGERRYVESLSSYARQFLGNTDKPDVDSIEGLSLLLVLIQKSTNKNPRSTVGTVTEIYDYLRLFICKNRYSVLTRFNKEPVSSQSIEEMTNKVLELKAGTKLQIYSPIVEGEKGTHKDLLEELRKMDTLE